MYIMMFAVVAMDVFSINSGFIYIHDIYSLHAASGSKTDLTKDIISTRMDYQIPNNTFSMYAIVG